MTVRNHWLMNDVALLYYSGARGALHLRENFMKKLILMIVLGLVGSSVYAQGTQVLSYGYPLQVQSYSAPVVHSVVPYQGVVVNGVVIDTTPRVTVIAPPVIVHPVPVVIQPVVPVLAPVPVVHRCWWPRPWVYNYGY